MLECDICTAPIHNGQGIFIEPEESDEYGNAVVCPDCRLQLVNDGKMKEASNV